MKIGIVGYQGSGKSTLFAWLTGAEPDPAQAHVTQSAMAAVPDPRIEALCEIYHPKKITRASLELVDTPGLSRDHQGSAAKLGLIREAGCLVLVVAAFNNADPAADIQNFEDDLLIADLDIVTKRVEKLRETVKKARPDRDELIAELAALEPLLAEMEAGRALRNLELNADQQRATKAFQLLTNKPRMVIVNTIDDNAELPELPDSAQDAGRILAFSLPTELELSQMDADERDEFCQEMEITPGDRDDLLRQIMDASRQMVFFTAGDKEVRTWMIPQGATAVESAGCIHTDLAKGFIRAEVMTCHDLLRLGGEREVKAENLARQEHKEYVIQDGDILNIRHN